MLFVGPRQLWIVARVNIDEHLSAAQIVALSDEAEQRVQAEAPEVLRVDLVTAGFDRPDPDPPEPGSSDTAAGDGLG